MVADLREMQENQWVSEIRIDKLEFACLCIFLQIIGTIHLKVCPLYQTYRYNTSNSYLSPLEYISDPALH